MAGLGRFLPRLCARQLVALLVVRGCVLELPALRTLAEPSRVRLHDGRNDDTIGVHGCRLVARLLLRE